MSTAVPLSDAGLPETPLDGYIYGLSLKNYPLDCPPCKIRWFHALDVPKRMPQLGSLNTGREAKPIVPPKNFTCFSPRDSLRLESKYQELLKDFEDSRGLGQIAPKPVETKVSVQEDLLFDVDVAKRELAPAFWLGPIYEVRRGSWFYPQGSGFRPCEENLAAQLEEGYLATKPWLTSQAIRTESQPLSQREQPEVEQPTATMYKTYNLTGAWLNSRVTFSDTSTAWVTSPGVLSRTASAVYEKLIGSGYLTGVKVVRGYSESALGGSDDEPLAEPAASTENIHKGYGSISMGIPDREIDHLILVTHGVGQSISIRENTLSFVNDINVLRNTIKTTYGASFILKRLNYGRKDAHENCRVQVLPVCWRHLIDFPQRRGEQNENEGSTRTPYSYPGLEDITLEGAAFARSLISDLALDVLLFQSSYREKLCNAVLSESNRLHKLFLQRNPGFKGKVHIVGYSLGSLIAFELLCRQASSIAMGEAAIKELQSERRGTSLPAEVRGFGFEIADFFCLGSPVGLFQMVKGRTIAARRPKNRRENEDPYGLCVLDPKPPLSPVTGHPFNVSSPNVSRLFNIFHPSDPISYRMEPLISAAMSKLRPQPLPSTRKGLLDTVALSMNELLARPAGQTGTPMRAKDGDEKLLASETATLNETTNDEEIREASALRASGPMPSIAASPSADLQFETLSARLERTGTILPWQKPKVDEQEAEQLRQEEMKVRALNSNGRVDYCVQTGILDSSPLGVLSSHLSYWSDADIWHFILQQLLT